MQKNPFPMVDIIIERNDKIVLIKRGVEPFKRLIAIPGGHMELGETIENAAKREAKEETSLDVELIDILGVYSDPKRDPRKHSMATVFIGKPIKGKLRAGDDAKEAFWMDLNKIESYEFAFDHKKILLDYLKWRKKKGTYWSTK
jgi:ADP-ribose pyrophosphatase YjhB (NUDIX family)